MVETASDRLIHLKHFLERSFAGANIAGVECDELIEALDEVLASREVQMAAVGIACLVSLVIGVGLGWMLGAWTS